MPAEAGIQDHINYLDSGFRRNDDHIGQVALLGTF
jgi:hypothetical protein